MVDDKLREAAENENSALGILLLWVNGKGFDDDLNVVRVAEEAGRALQAALAEPLHSLATDAKGATEPTEEMIRRLHNVLISVEPFLDHGDADVYLRSEVANLRGTLANMVRRAVLAVQQKEGQRDAKAAARAEEEYWSQYDSEEARRGEQ